MNISSSDQSDSTLGKFLSRQDHMSDKLTFCLSVFSTDCDSGWSKVS